MKNTITLAFTLFFSHFLMSQIVINELDCDTPGVDDKEFLELKSDTPNFSLDGYVVVFFNGSTSGADSSYFTIDLDGYTTDDNGLLLIGSDNVNPFPQLVIASNVIQNGADAVAVYLGSSTDFPEGTLATQTNLIDALAYDTADADDTVLMGLLGLTEQINEGSSNNTNSIQRFVDMSSNVTYSSVSPTPRALNDGSGITYNPITISTTQTQFNEGDSFDITFTTEQNVTGDYNFNFTLDNGGFSTADFTGNTSVTILNGQNSVTTSITLIDDILDEGDEEPIIKFENLTTPYIPYNNFIKLRVVDNDFVVAPWGTPTNPTYGIVASTQPSGYYDSLEGLADNALRQALQDIIANPATVRAQTYNDVIDILKEADVNPENSNQVWLVYTEQGRAKLDFQTSSNNVGTWNREHTYPRSRGGFNNIDLDDIIDGPDVYWATKADSLRHGNSDAHALRAADGPENSTRGNQHYGQYNGPVGNLGSFKGDVARSVLFMEIRYNGLAVVNGFPSTTGELGDLTTLLDWHRNDPPDDFEMNRNNIVYNWQKNRNPFIDQPDLVEYIWGNNIGDSWTNPLNIEDVDSVRFSIYPNPAKDKLYISGTSSNYTISFYSLDGRKLFTEKILNNNFLKLHLASGLYMLKIETEGKSIVKKVFIK
ncbi:endonuclease [Pseudofulvibacter geojedonensis]|uniref:Endonuclease n=1 Tax=Pseudofulvibacter geojedonensis TaxID=1123758 RepID=A0ABW3I364_9FLAO